MLKLWVPLLPRLVGFAILIEARDGRPGTVGTGLTGLRIERLGKRVLFGKHGTIALQIVLADTAFVHPQAQALVTDELHDADRVVDSLILCLIAVQFVLLYQHVRSLPLPTLNVVSQYPEHHVMKGSPVFLGKASDGFIDIPWIPHSNFDDILFVLHSTSLAQ